MHHSKLCFVNVNSLTFQFIDYLHSNDDIYSVDDTVNNKCLYTPHIFAQLDGAVEYTDCISAEE